MYVVIEIIPFHRLAPYVCKRYASATQQFVVYFSRDIIIYNNDVIIFIIVIR